MSHIAGADALLEVAVLVQLLTITTGMLAGAVASAIWLKLWRYAVAVSYAASIVRSDSVGSGLSTSLWHVVQFGPLAIAAVPLLTGKNASMRPIDLGILACLALFAFCALVTAFTGVFRAQTLAQSALLVLMFGFLALTLSRRWLTLEVIRQDLTLGFGLICGAQVVGLIGALTHQPWATADYGRFEGLFSNANYAGAMSAIGLMIGLYVISSELRNHMAWGIAGMLALGLTLLLSGSRGALLALVVGLIPLVRIRASRRVVLLAVGGVIAVGLGLTVMSYLRPSLGGAFNRALQGSDITSGRLQIYSELVTRWWHMPWFGTGYRTTELLTGPHRLTGHDTYLSVLTETGIVGAVVFIVLLVLILQAGPALKTNRALLGAVVTVLMVEVTESFLFGWGSPIPIFEWLTLLGFAAEGRLSGAVAAWPWSSRSQGPSDRRSIVVG